MKEIVVISGKGGTGKTSLTASFAMLAGKDIVVADCDVDAADMHLLLEPDFEETEDFYSGEEAYIVQESCIQCGKCEEVCRFNAIDIVKGRFVVNAFNCEGCGYCARICPTKAIVNKEVKVGECFTSNIKTGTYMVHARLGVGADNSGKLVAKVKNEAKELAKVFNKDYVLVDGSPGVGCPVVSSLSGASFVILVTEPTVSGLHDLKRVYQLVKKFNIKTGCIINKADLNIEKTTEVESFLKSEAIVHLANLPYDEDFTKAMVSGKTIVEYNHGLLSELISNSWNKTLEILK
jgi:MinD superfamily P-loop ATPase